MQVRDRVIIVTGASSGIGAATARALLASGARVVLAARRADRLEGLVAESGHPERAAAVATDLCRHDDLQRLVDSTLARFGRLDAVIHCAGLGVTAHLDKTPPETLEELVRVNLLAPIWLTRLALPALRESPEGLIVLVSSMSALVPPPLQSAYVASKVGLKAFADVLRGDLEGTRIRVVSIFPGVVDTPMIADFRTAQERTGFVAPVPMQAADDAAAEIVAALERSRANVILGGWQNRLAAGLTRWLPWVVRAGLRRMRPEFERLADTEAQVRAEREGKLTPR